jgi:hypothetical protein
MPIPLLAEGFGRGLSNIPYAWTAIQGAVLIAIITLLKQYFGGATCRSERVMHGKVVMVTVKDALSVTEQLSDNSA